MPSCLAAGSAVNLYNRVASTVMLGQSVEHVSFMDLDAGIDLMRRSMNEPNVMIPLF
jgi:hypothetical protein